MEGKDTQAALTARVSELEAALSRKAELENKLIRKEAEIARLMADWTTRLKAKDDDLNALKVRLVQAEAGAQAAAQARAQTRPQQTGAAAASALALRGKDDEINALKRRINDLTTTLQAKDAALAGGNAQLTALRAQVDSASAQAATELQQSRYTHQMLETSLKSRDGAVAQLQAALAEVGERERGLAAQLAGKDRDVHDARWRVGELEAELSRLRDEQGRLSSQLAETDKGFHDAKWRIGELDAIVAGKDKAVHDLRWRIGELEAELAATRDQRSQLDKAFHDARWRAGELEAELNTAREALARGDAELRQVTVNKELDDARWRIGELSAVIALKDEQIEAALGRASSLEAGQRELERVIATLRAGMVAPESATVPSTPPEPALSIQSALDAGLAAGVVARSAPAPIETASLPPVPVGADVEPTPTVFNLKKTFVEAAAQEAGIDVVTSPCPQDLSEIEGVGAVFAQRLHDHGIGTYWEVAHLSDADLRTALQLDVGPRKGRGGNRVLQVNFEAIRADALRLAHSTQTQGRTWTGGKADDFEPIEGIGRVFELRLLNAGICTYEALMNTNVDRLAEICKPPKQFKTPDYASWIAQASTLAAAKSAGTPAPKPASTRRKRAGK